MREDGRRKESKKKQNGNASEINPLSTKVFLVFFALWDSQHVPQGDETRTKNIQEQP